MSKWLRGIADLWRPDRTRNTVRDRIELVANTLGAPPGLLPTFGSSDQTGRPHVEVDSRGYHYVVCERGEELKRRTSVKEDDLVFWAAETMAFSLACDYELSHRVVGQDFRRLLFARKLELLRTVSPAWERRARADVERILQEHPYRDDLGASQRTVGGREDA